MQVQRGDIREILGARPTALQVYLAMEHIRGGKDRPFEASNSTLQDLTRQSPPTILDAVKDLVRAKIISAETAPGRSTRYVVLKSFARPFSNLGGPKGPKRPKELLPKRVPTEEPCKNIKTSPEKRRAAVYRALTHLGSSRTSPRLVGQSMKCLYGLVEHDGFTVAEALEVVRWCRDEYDRTRFRPLLNLPYIWSVKQFTSLLTASRISKSDEGETLAEQQARRESNARRLRARGLMSEVPE